VVLSRQTHGNELSGSLTDLLGLETLMGAMITVESASKAGAVAMGRPKAPASAVLSRNVRRSHSKSRMARAGVGNLPFTLLKQLIHQLPSADAIIRGIPCSKITRGEYLVNLVGDRVPIANVLEVLPDQDIRHNSSALSLDRR